MKHFYRLISVIFVLSATGYFLVFAFSHFSSIPIIHWNFQAFVCLVAAVSFYIFQFLISAFAWRLLLSASGEITRLADIIIILCVSQFAKYMPGNIGHHVGRVALARTYNLNVTRVIFTMTLEAGWAIVGSSFLAFVVLLTAGKSLFKAMPQLPSVWQIVAVATAASLIPLLGAWAINTWRPSPLRKLLGNDEVIIPSRSVFFACFLLYSLNFLLLGIILNILAQGLFDAPHSNFWLLTGFFAVAWVAGFISPGAPAGLGVREAILTAALSPLYGAGAAVGISCALRVVTTFGDGLAFVAALIAKRMLSNIPDASSYMQKKTMPRQEE